MLNIFYLVPLLPLIGFIVNFLLGKKINNEKISGIISSVAVFIPFAIGIGVLFEILSLPPEARKIPLHYFSWLFTGILNVNFAYIIDPLSVVMLLVVTGVGFLIHLYSIGYMHGDRDFHLFFAYMNLFIFAMLQLILADNFLLIFLGWEGVGLCSYLLIGFWYEKKFTGDAAKKAFVVNRIGDFGFMTAMFLIFNNFGSLDITHFLGKISNGVPINDGLLIAIGLLLFLGATGKSAQIPLFVWLPDAMAGPTPVSALIHAATMVTAGVYLIARVSLLYSLVPLVNTIILITGILTALLAASMALKQNDIKKILAYSTISQLGFMFIAIGVSAYHIAIFHLMTHAFFKALMFLGSGSVIHSLHEEQDVRNMGGLKDKMKITYITFLIGALAISGIPPLSGFFSKDEILWNTFIGSNFVFYLIVLFTAVLTAFYMFRLIGLTFFGNPRYDTEHLHPHESPATMTIPLIILAILSAIGGFIGLPHYTGAVNYFEHFLEPVFQQAMTVYSTVHPHSEHSLTLELILVAVSVIAAGISAVLSFRIFSRKEKFEPEKGFGKLLEDKYYIDEAYYLAVVNPIHKTSENFLWKIFDVKVIDAFVNWIADYFVKLSADWRKIQTGVIQDYTTITVAGIVVIILYLLFL